MKAKKMIVPILMGALMAFAILPMTAGTAHATDYFDLQVGVTQVTSNNALSIPGVGGGTASYDAESKTLTLNGVTIPGENFWGILSEIPDLTIEVHGENKVSGGDAGILSSHNFTITGDGSLQAKGSDNGIVSDGGVTIKDAIVTATATGNDSIGIEASGEIKIEGRSKVQAQGTADAIYSYKKITLGGGHVITEPVNGRISDDGQNIVDQYGNNATSVTIERVVKMNGDGTAGSPYQIKTYEDLQEFAAIVNGTHDKASQDTDAYGELMNDIIDCGNDQEWVPIGNHDNKYTGHFDGNNKVIKGLSSISRADYQGLFGYIGSGGEVKNVGLEGGMIKGASFVGGVAGWNEGTIMNCYNGGEVRGAGTLGGMVGCNNGGTISSCYNTGAISAGPHTGGLVGYNSGGTITNCYNTGAVSGSAGVSGLVGKQRIGEIINCYNSGAVNGRSKVGGVVGNTEDNYGTITNCYYDRAFNMFTKAVGDTGDTGNVKNVKGLTTSQMTGETALADSNMFFSYNPGEENPWIVKANGIDPKSGDYYLYYPHLKGFNLNSDNQQIAAETIEAANWPAKLITAADWNNEAASYPYTASPQGPSVTKVTISQKPVKVPGDKTGLYSRKTDSGWDALTAAPTGKGTYKLTIKDGDDVIDEIIFVILDPAADYTVDYYKQTGGTGWTKIGSSNPVDAGEYKAAVTLSDGTVLGEKVFQIAKAPLTITANDQSYVYNGQTQGEGDTAYEDAAQIAEKVTVKGLQGSDELTKIEVDGQGKEVGEYVLRPNDAAVGNATDNYEITYVNGTLKITKMSITPSVSIEGWVYGSAENKPVVTGNAGGGKETFLYKKTDEPDSAYTETVPTDAGEYTVKAKIAETANYKAGEATVDFTISPADMEVTAGDYQGTYDGAEHGITVNAPEGATVEYSSDGGESWSGEKPVFTEAGTHNTDFRVNLANYKEYTGSRQVIILQAAITIKADDKSSKYGEALKKLTYKVSGAYVKSDDLGVKLSTAAKKNKAGTTAINVSWNNNPNYEAKLVNGKYTVKKENTKPSGPTKAEKKADKIALDAGIVARSSGKKVTASWGAVKGASSYVIYANYCDQKNCKKLKTVSGKTTSIDITKVNGKKFNPKKNLKFYVVAYKTVKGKKVKLATSITAHAPGSKNSKRTNVTGVKVKKASFKLKKGKTAKIKAKLVLEKKSRKPLKHEAKFRYASSNTKVAKVSKKGKITAVGKGKCTVYVYAVSGVSKKIKVTVK